jgi:phosphosulfolactate phosphohydrolase-like enzyme
MQVNIRNGYEVFDPKKLPDLRILVDVFRASTTAVGILKKQPDDYLIANELATIERFMERGYRVVSEVFHLGLDNSPTLIRDQMGLNEKIIHKTTNLTTAIETNFFQGPVAIGCFSNMGALVQWIQREKFDRVEIIPAGLMEQRKPAKEDTHCAESIQERLLTGSTSAPDVEFMLAEFQDLKKRRNWPAHFIADIEWAVQMDTELEIPMVMMGPDGTFRVTSVFE